MSLVVIVYTVQFYHQVYGKGPSAFRELPDGPNELRFLEFLSSCGSDCLFTDTERSGADCTNRAKSCAQGHISCCAILSLVTSGDSLFAECPTPHARQQFYLLLIKVLCQTMCPRCWCSVPAFHHSHYQCLQKDNAKACSPFPTEVSHPSGYPETLWSEAVHFRMGKETKEKPWPP